MASFNQEQLKQITALAKWMRIVSVYLLLLGSAYIIQMLAQSDITIMGLMFSFYLLIGGTWGWNASTAFFRVSRTAELDLDILLVALNELKRLFAFLAVICILTTLVLIYSIYTGNWEWRP